MKELNGLAYWQAVRLHRNELAELLVRLLDVFTDLPVSRNHNDLIQAIRKSLSCLNR